MPGHNINFQLRNEAGNPSYEAVVSWKIHTPIPISGRDTIQLSSPIPYNSVQRCSLNTSKLIKVPYVGRFRYTFVLEPSICNKFSGPKDTLKFWMDNTPRTVPFLQTFDTINTDYLPSQYRSDPPNWHEWKKYAYPTYARVNANLLEILDGSLPKQIWTEPIVLLPGRTYVAIRVNLQYWGNLQSTQPADSVTLAATLDSGRTWQTLHHFRNSDIHLITDRNIDKLKIYESALNVAYPTVTHLRFTIYSNGSSSVPFFLKVDSIRYSLSPILGVEEPELQASAENLRLYPNPSNTGTFRLAGQEQACLVQVVSLAGQVLANEILQPNQELKLPNTPEGMYLVKVTSATKTQILRWVMER